MPTVSEVKRMLKKANCKFLKEGTNHEWWINLKTGEKFQIPRHKTKEMADKTLESIKKSAGLK